jgi:hypothetical protein
MTKPAKAETPEPDGPAVITPFHRQDRPTSTAAGAKLAWRSESTLEAAYDKGQLQGGSPRYSAETRYEAGRLYSTLYDQCQPSGRDSTQSMNISRTTRPGNEADTREDAWTKLIAIDSHLGQRDRMIVRMVCGDNETPAVAVRLVCADYRHTVAARLREAIDGLIEAIEAARKGGWKRFNMEVKP